MFRAKRMIRRFRTDDDGQPSSDIGWNGSTGAYRSIRGVRCLRAKQHLFAARSGLTNDSMCDSCRRMTPATDSLPTDLAAAHAVIREMRTALGAAEARASALESEAKHRALLIEKLKYTIAKLRHERSGQSSKRGAILEQLELKLAQLQEDVSAADWRSRGDGRRRVSGLPKGKAGPSGGASCGSSPLCKTP